LIVTILNAESKRKLLRKLKKVMKLFYSKYIIDIILLSDEVVKINEYEWG